MKRISAIFLFAALLVCGCSENKKREFVIEGFFSRLPDKRWDVEKLQIILLRDGKKMWLGADEVKKLHTEIANGFLSAAKISEVYGDSVAWTEVGDIELKYEDVSVLLNASSLKKDVLALRFSNSAGQSKYYCTYPSLLEWLFSTMKAKDTP
jgi:hypothetical protein